MIYLTVEFRLVSQIISVFITMKSKTDRKLCDAAMMSE